MKTTKKSKGRSAVVLPEKYSTARKAEFLLSNASTATDYQRARKQVRALGLDPHAITHAKPR